MATSASFTLATQLPTNITSSLSMANDKQHFATLSRELASNSSQWIYRLDYYDTTPTLLESIDVYSTYNVNKHFLTFTPTTSQRELIAVATNKNIIFYQTNPLELMKSELHRQANVYDLTASPNGELVVLVGQSIVVYRVIGFK